MSIDLTLLSSEKLRLAVKDIEGGGGDKHHFLSFHKCDRAATDKRVEKWMKIRPCVPEISRAKVYG